MTDENRVKEPLHCVRCGAEVVEKPLPKQGGGNVEGMSIFVRPHDCHDPAGTGLDTRDLPAGGVVNLPVFGLVGVDTLDTLKARSDQTRGMSMEERMRRSPELGGDAPVLGALAANTARLARKYGEGPEAEALARGATDEEVAHLQDGFKDGGARTAGQENQPRPDPEKLVEAMRGAEAELLGEPPESVLTDRCIEPEGGPPEGLEGEAEARVRGFVDACDAHGELGTATDGVLPHDLPMDDIPETPDAETLERLKRAGVIPYVWLATAAALGGGAWAALRAFFSRGG